MAAESVPLIFLRLGLGALFLFSGTTKLADPEAFQQSVAAYEIIPTFLGLILGWYLPALEMVCGLALIVGWSIRGAALIVQTMLFIFTLAIVSAWLRGLEIHCGCFGSWLDWGSYPWWISRNVALFGLACLLNK